MKKQNLLLLATAAGVAAVVLCKKKQAKGVGALDIDQQNFLRYSKHWPKDGRLSELFATYDRLYAEEIEHEAACDKITEAIWDDRLSNDENWAACENAWKEAGLVDENGNTEVYAKTLQAWRNLRDFVIYNIFPPEAREDILYNKNNVIQMRKMLDFVRQYLGKIWY